MKRYRLSLSLFCILACFLFSSCTTLPKTTTQAKQTAYSAEQDNSLGSRYSPVFVIENHGKPYNRIGTPKARSNSDGAEEVFVDPDEPAFYYTKQTFDTGNKRYTNLIYRVHFQGIPYSLVPFYLGAGENVGLLIVITLNGKGEPLLYSVVHTCGCYLAFIPTSFMPDEAYPPDWDKKRQSVYGEQLPGFLLYPPVFRETIRPVILLRDATHRVKEIGVRELKEARRNYLITPARLKPVEALDTIPVEEGGTTSFFETSGPRRGYVKGSHKPWERLLMSWWTMDWRIGEDKKLGPREKTGTVFYTSAKFWAHEESDMWEFSDFLEYWGWKLL